MSESDLDHTVQVDPSHMVPQSSQRRRDILGQLRPNLDRNSDHFLRTFAGFKKHRENTRGSPKVQKLVQKVSRFRDLLS